MLRCGVDGGVPSFEVIPGVAEVFFWRRFLRKEDQAFAEGALAVGEVEGEPEGAEDR